jgi:hypothetical protein
VLRPKPYLNCFLVFDAREILQIKDAYLLSQKHIPTL